MRGRGAAPASVACFAVASPPAGLGRPRRAALCGGGAAAASRPPLPCRHPARPHRSARPPSCCAGAAAAAGRTRTAAATTLTSVTVDASLLTPMMSHWVATKRAHPQFLILYRVGDFFETFFEDATRFARLCDVALTAKDAGKALGARVPMSGIPHHTLDDKCRVLLAHAVNVAVVDQVEAASAAAPGALVRRAVTRLITPGTLVDDALLDTSKPNYLACVSVASWRTATLRFGLALADVCTGELRATDGEGLDALERCLRAAQPAELLLAAGADGRLLDGADSLLSSPPSASRAGLGDVAALARRAGVPVVTGRPSPDFAVPRCNAELCSRFSVDNVESLGCRGRDEVVSAVGALLSFVSGTVEVDGRGRVPFCRPALFSPRDCLEMDEAALRNLEVVETMRGGSSGKSLRWAVDRTVTAMGARRVRSWLLAPLTDVDAIMYRQRIVVRLARDGELRSTLSEQLRGVADLERLAGRVGGDRASPRELQRLAQSLVKLPDVRDVLSSAGGDASPFAEIVGALGHGAPPSAAVPSASPESMDGLGRVIVDALVDPAPSALLSTPALAHLVSSTPGVAGHEAGRVFRAGYCAELDLLRASESDPAKWIAAFEEQEQERTGVSSLRVKRLRNSGYVIRVARSAAERKLERDPASFSDVGYERTLSTKSEMRFRSATLAAREREEEAMVRAVGRLEWDLFHALLLRVGRLTDGIRKAAAGVAELDALLGFARLSSEQNYVAPIVEPGPSRVLHIVDGRHPVVELNLAPGRTYVPNSFRMGTLRDECGDVGPAAATAAAEAAAVVADADDLPACDEMILCGPNASCVHMCLPPLALLRASRM